MLLALLGGRLTQFLLGPAGKVLLLGVAFAGWTLYQRHDATKSCESAELQRELLAAQEQLEIAERIAENARERANGTEQEMTQVRKLYDDLKDDLDRLEAGASCPIDPAIAERLRQIK